MSGNHEHHDRIEAALDAKAGDTALPGSTIEDRWLNLVHREVRITRKQMRDAIREQGKADNRAKPILTRRGSTPDAWFRGIFGRGNRFCAPEIRLVNYPTPLALMRSLRVGLPGSATRFLTDARPLPTIRAGSAVSAGVDSE